MKNEKRTDEINNLADMMFSDLQDQIIKTIKCYFKNEDFINGKILVPALHLATANLIRANVCNLSRMTDENVNVYQIFSRIMSDAYVNLESADEEGDL